MRMSVFLSLMLVLFGSIIGLVIGTSNSGTPKPIKEEIYESARQKRYRLEVRMKYFVLWDADRVVDTIPFGNSGQLDTVVLKDNL